jgi:hypothetical protein
VPRARPAPSSINKAREVVSSACARASARARGYRQSQKVRVFSRLLSVTHTSHLPHRRLCRVVLQALGVGGSEAPVEKWVLPRALHVAAPAAVRVGGRAGEPVGVRASEYVRGSVLEYGTLTSGGPG